MPKTVLSRFKDDPSAFQTEILGTMALKGIRFGDIPGASESTYRRKIRSPMNLTIEDIANVFSALKIKDDDQERLLLALFNSYKER